MGGLDLTQAWERVQPTLLNHANLQNIDYIDSAGLGALVYAYTTSKRRGTRLVLVRVFGKNRELLRITKLLTVFDVYETTLEAERSFSRPPEASVM